MGGPYFHSNIHAGGAPPPPSYRAKSPDDMHGDDRDWGAWPPFPIQKETNMWSLFGVIFKWSP